MREDTNSGLRKGRTVKLADSAQKSVADYKHTTSAILIASTKHFLILRFYENINLKKLGAGDVERMMSI